MRYGRGIDEFLFCALTALVFLGLARSPVHAQVPPCLQPPPNGASTVAGQYCGVDTNPPNYPVNSDAPDSPGLSLSIDRYCVAKYGFGATAATLGPTYGDWVCRLPTGQSAHPDMQDVCHFEYGNTSLATLVGLKSFDWRCLRPADVSGHVVPVLLYPRPALVIEPFPSFPGRVGIARIDFNAEAAFVTSSLQKIATLVGGIRRFYREKTSARVRGTSAFVQLTSVSGKDWQNLALCTDQNACTYIGSPFPFNRYGYSDRIKSELANWNVLKANSTVILSGFVSLGFSYPQTPTWCGAADYTGFNLLISAPSNSYATCSLGPANPPIYENAFYGTGHELGHAFGLRHSNDPAYCPDPNSYAFNDVDPSSNLLRPANLRDSIMCLGQGTSSELFPFEVGAVLPFLLNWH